MNADAKTADAKAAETVEIAGTVSVLNFTSPKFSAGKLYVRGRDVSFSVKGYAPKVGEPITLRGEWTTHPKWGKQFTASEVVYILPTDPDGLVRWLRWYADEVGPVKAQRLVDEFGTDLPRLLAEDPGQVAACAAIPIECVHRVAERWAKSVSHVGAATQLAAWGLSQHDVEALLAKFRSAAPAVVRDDPFAVLGEVDGFGWVKTDELAAKVGVTGSDPRRVRGAVAAVVREARENGHTVLPLGDACQVAADKIGLPAGGRELAADLVGLLVERKQLVRLDAAEGRSWLCTPWAHRCESAVWRVLARSREANPQAGAEVGTVDFRLLNLAHKYESLVVNGVECKLDDTQVGAVYGAAKYRVSVITGGAGSGKTLCARQITKLFTDDDVDVMLCAPTGKAARRLEEVIGRKATTIHRLLEYSGSEGRFTRNAENPLPPGVVVCDEASMMGSPLTHSLFSALGPKTSLVLIGDDQQIPPVEEGATLRDILAHDLAPVTRLGVCHRQAGVLKQNCSAVLKGRVEPWASTEPDPCPWVVSRKANTPEAAVKIITDLYRDRLSKWGFDPIKDTQFMTAKHDGPLGTKRLNLVLQRMHQATLGVTLPELGGDDHRERATLYVGDKVLNSRNDYTLDVMNGAVGVVLDVHPLTVEFPDRVVVYPKESAGQVVLAYCLTPHKCQGSEYPCAVTIVPKSHAFSQHRNWLYTATTRAKTTCVLIGDDDGLRRAVEKVVVDRRQTLLGVFARHEETRP